MTWRITPNMPFGWAQFGRWMFRYLVGNAAYYCGNSMFRGYLWERIHSRCDVSAAADVECAGLSRMNSLPQVFASDPNPLWERHPRRFHRERAVSSEHHPES